MRINSNCIRLIRVAPKPRLFDVTKVLVSLLVLTLLTALVPALAEGPEDQYLQVYNLVEQADALDAGGKSGPALAKYREAQAAMQRFQKTYPTWNAKVVTFRANYLTEKIAALTEKTHTSSGTSTTSNTQTAAGGKAASSASAAQVKLLDAGAEPRKALRLHPKPGDQQKVEISIKMVMTTKVGEMETPAVKIPTMKFGLNTTVKSVSDSGDIAFEITTGDASIADEPDTMPQVAQMMKSMLGGLNGQSGAGTMSSRGVTRDFEMKAPSGGDAQARQMMDQLKDSMSNLGNALPEEAVGPGAKWEVKTPIKYQGMNIDQTTTYELVSVEGERVTAKVSVTQHAANQKVSSPAMPGMKADLTKMTGSGKGEVSVELTRLLPRSQTEDSQSEFSMSITAGGQKQSITQKLERKIRVEAK